MFLPYVYRVTHKQTGQYYIGMRSANKVIAEQDLGVRYFTSSKYVKNNFSLFNVEILAYFRDQISAFEFENNLIEQCWEDPRLLNKHYQKSMTKFSMTGFKRPDLVEQNKRIKSKPKENREYVCTQCGAHFQKVEFIHYPVKEKPFCSHVCSARHSGIHNSTKGKPNLKNRGREAWNKGKPNPMSAANAKKGAAKLSDKAKGRSRLYRPDGSWTWQYPEK